jgi:hypothetical protein
LALAQRVFELIVDALPSEYHSLLSGPGL